MAQKRTGRADSSWYPIPQPPPLSKPAHFAIIQVIHRGSREQHCLNYEIDLSHVIRRLHPFETQIEQCE